jgi:eukaryotic-like serine/threonine-protein kinase
VPDRSLTLSVKIFLGTSAVVVLALGATLAITARSANRAADASVERVVGAAREAFNAQVGGRSDALLKAAEVFAGNSSFRDIVAQRDYGNALDQSIVAAEQTGADWAQITDEQGIRLAKSDDPTAAEESLASSPAIGGALEGNFVAAFGISADTVLIQVAVVPVEDGGRVYGALMVVRGIDDAFAETVKQAAFDQLEVVFYALDSLGTPRVNASTLDRALLTPALLQELHRIAEAEESGMSENVSLANTDYVALGGILRSAGGAPLGGFALLRNRDAEFALFRAFERTILLTGALALLFAALFSLLVAKWVTRPVAKLADAARRASDGDYAAEITATSRDEIGALAGAFRRLLADLREKQDLVEFLGGGSEARTVQMALPTGTQARQAAGVGLVPGSVFAMRYEVKEIIGQGGMGTVFKAVDRELNEVIAIKTLKQEFLTQDPTALERFKSEIRLARRISHRNVVRTHDLGERDGVYFITMEYVEGKSLKELIRARGKLPVSVTLSVGKQLARALEIAHEQGVIHRDIKPQNMVVEPDGVLKVMDFGIARLAQRPQDSGVTQQGMLVGTPDYMAPEQMMGAAVDPRADLYAVGCVLFECLTGRTPFLAETSYQLVAQVLEEFPPRVRSLSPEVPEGLDTLVADLLQKSPDKRPASALALHERLAKLD